MNKKQQQQIRELFELQLENRKQQNFAEISQVVLIMLIKKLYREDTLTLGQQLQLLNALSEGNHDKINEVIQSIIEQEDT